MPQSLTVGASPGPSAGEAQYQLHIQPGAEGAAFGFQYALPSWPTAEPVFGSPVQVVSVGLFGAGLIRPVAGPPPKRMLLRRNGCNRGIPDPFSQRYWVEVPANNASVVSLQVKAAYPAWPGTRYRMTFSTFALDDPRADLVPLGAISEPRLMSKGTHIKIWSQEPIQQGLTPRLTGRTFPPLRLARISLKVVRVSLSNGVSLEDWAGPQAISLGAVRTDRQGRFSVPPQPLEVEGRFAVIARSEARSAREADWNCGAFFSNGKALAHR